MQLTKQFLMSFAFVTTYALPAHALEVGDNAPCVELTDIQPDGKEVEQCVRTRAETQGCVLLEFFASTCPDCLENLPRLNSLSQQISGTTAARIVSVDRDAQAARAFLTSHRSEINVPVALDSDREAKRAYGVTATPTLFLLDAKNKIIYKRVDVLTPDEEGQIQKLAASACQRAHR